MTKDPRLTLDPAEGVNRYLEPEKHAAIERGQASEEDRMVRAVERLEADR